MCSDDIDNDDDNDDDDVMSRELMRCCYCRPGYSQCLTLIKPALTVGRAVELIKTSRNIYSPTPLRDPTPVEYVIRALKTPVTG